MIDDANVTGPWGFGTINTEILHMGTAETRSITTRFPFKRLVKFQWRKISRQDWPLTFSQLTRRPKEKYIFAFAHNSRLKKKKISLFSFYRCANSLLPFPGDFKKEKSFLLSVLSLLSLNIEFRPEESDFVPRFFSSPLSREKKK